MFPEWKDKVDPQKHPVRYLAALWQQRLAHNPRVSGRAFTKKQFGQLKLLKDFLGGLAPYAITWMVKPENWLRFCQNVREQAELKAFRLPDDPDIGFLFWQRQRILGIMRDELRNSTDACDLQFCRQVDKIKFQQWKSLLLVFAAGNPHWVTRIEAAKTVEEMQHLWIELPDSDVIK